MVLLLKREGDSRRLEEIHRRTLHVYLSFSPHQSSIAGTSPKAPFQGAVPKQVAPSLQGKPSHPLNLHTLLFLFAPSRLQKSPLHLPSSIQALSSIPSSIPSCFSRSFAGRPLCMEEGSLRHLVSIAHHHRQLRLKEGLIHFSHENPFFFPHL